MLPLMKKFSIIFIFFIALYMIMIFPLLNYDRIKGNDQLDLAYILYQGSFLIWVALGALWAHENMENKTNGYRFLRTLPIRTSDIVMAKFMLILITILIYVSYQSVMVAQIVRNPEYAATSRIYVTNLGNICLILCALVYIGIYKFGYEKFGKFVLLAWFILFMSPVLLREFIMPKFSLSLSDIIHSLTQFNWIIATLVCLPLYFVLMQVAIRLKSQEIEQ